MRTILLIWLFVLLIPGAGREVQAADFAGMAEEQLAASGAEELTRLVPGNAAESGEELLRLAGQSRWNPAEILRRLWELFAGELTEPLRLFGTLCGILLLSALLRAFSGEMGQSLPGKAYGAAVSLCISAAMMEEILPLIRESGRVIRELTAFMLSFIPVFSGVIATSGRPASALAYQSVTFVAAQIFSRLAEHLLMPLAGIFLAVCLAGTAAEELDTGGIAKSVRNLAGWVLGLCLAVFTALLTLQSLTAGAADSVGSRAAKFVLSSAVPVVGGALSEAYGALTGCLGMVKNTVGIFGVLVMGAAFLPVLSAVGAGMLALNLAAAAGELLGESRPAGLIRGASAVLSMLGGLILCYGMMILVSVTILLWMGMPSV